MDPPIPARRKELVTEWILSFLNERGKEMRIRKNRDHPDHSMAKIS